MASTWRRLQFFAMMAASRSRAMTNCCVTAAYEKSQIRADGEAVLQDNARTITLSLVPKRENMWRETRQADAT
jgi:hypothetical protein